MRDVFALLRGMALKLSLQVYLSTQVSTWSLVPFLPVDFQFSLKRLVGGGSVSPLTGNKLPRLGQQDINRSTSNEEKGIGALSGKQKRDFGTRETRATEHVGYARPSSRSYHYITRILAIIYVVLVAGQPLNLNSLDLEISCRNIGPT